MSLKVIVLIICIGVVIWFVTIGRVQITEENVRALYEQSEAAFERADGKAYCDLFSDDMSGKFTSRAPSAPISNTTDTINKRFVCASVARFYSSQEEMARKAGRLINVKRSYETKSISISPDKKSATAEVQTDIRWVADIGEIMILKIHQNDQIEIKSGKIKFSKREAVGTYSAGEAGNPAYR
ncbi:MAG: hypothetical protein LBQ81_05710 [Zoogloeaceae bacterium]|nr:hypothetical protein [Zoogloeaceae bacterium]